MKLPDSHKEACKILKRDPKALPDVSKLPKKRAAAVIADHQLIDIAEAIHFVEKFKVDPKDRTQKKWKPYFDTAGGFGFVSSYYVDWRTHAFAGSRLCFWFGSKISSDHFGKKFNKLHKISLSV